MLAADKVGFPGWPALGYFRRITERYLTAVCHQPAAATELAIEPPPPADLDEWLLSAPPMTGGDYLDTAVLACIWNELDGGAQE